MKVSSPTSPSPATLPPPQRWLTRGVLGIGLASLFSDWGHEAATAILPAFLASLGAPAFALGVIEGVSDGFSSFAKLAGGWIADRPKLRKPTGIVGYFATGLSTFAYAFAHSWLAVLVMRALGWVGRGSRGPSRDTLLADCVAPEQRSARAESCAGRCSPASPPAWRSRFSRPREFPMRATALRALLPASRSYRQRIGITSPEFSRTASAILRPRC
jgi:hypothetical protein